MDSLPSCKLNFLTFNYGDGEGHHDKRGKQLECKDKKVYVYILTNFPQNMPTFFLQVCSPYYVSIERLY